MNTKQVIVIRKDLNMRKGKMCAQASHASMAFLTKNSSLSVSYIHHNDGNVYLSWDDADAVDHPLKKHILQINQWFRNSFRKIVCYVNSEEELVAIHEKALAAGMLSHLIEDNGLTEFNGVKTKTAVSVGPDWDDAFIGITDGLPLL